MPITEQILIEFITDASQLETAIDQLTRTGAVDSKLANAFKLSTAEINKQGQALQTVSSLLKPIEANLKGLSFAGINTQLKPIKNNLQDVAAAVKNTSREFEKGFSEGVMDALQQAGVSLEDFLAQLQQGPAKGGAAVKSIKSELRELTEQIARAKATGIDYGESYDALVLQAGRLKDAVGDVNQEINNVASDTSGIDGLIGAATGVAGAFSVAQGAAALFGDESEDVQKALLKLNAVMAVFQGLQAVSNTLQKESAASRFLDTAATKAQVAAQKLYSFVVGQSTGALKGFRLALAATGIGLLIIALGALVANWDKVKEAISGVSKSQKDLVETTEKTVEAEEKKLDVLSDQDNLLKLQGKTEKQILEIKIKQVDAVIQARKQQILAQESLLKSQIEAEKRNREILSGIINFLSIPLNGLIATVNAISKAIGSDFKIPDVGSLAKHIFDETEVEKEGKKSLDEMKTQLSAIENERAGFELNINEINKAALEQRLKDQVAKIEKQLLLAEAGSKKELALQHKLIDAKAAVELAGAKSQAESELINTKRIQEHTEADLAAEKKKIEARIAGIEVQLKAVEKGSREELRLKQQLIAEQAAAEIATTKKTQAQKDELLRASNQEQITLAKDFNAQLTSQAIQDQISLNNAELATLQEGATARLQLLLSNIDLAARQEVEAAKGNAAKIKEIYAKREADIRNIKIQFAREAEEKLLEKEERRQQGTREILEAIATDERKSVEDRINALEKLKDFDLQLLDIRLKALFAAHAKMEISDEDYADKYTDIQNKIAKITKDTGKKQEAIINESTQKWVAVAIQGFEAIATVIQSIGDVQSQNAEQKIARDRKALEDAREAGAISEKEAIIRAKRIDAEERKLKTEQAKREKQAALFSALINVARAVSNMLATTAGPQAFVAAAIAAAIATAQVIAIAARPIPKFKKGKKNRYEGLGEVGEAGAEIIERNGKMFVVKEPTITWLGSKDIVYTPFETKKMLYTGPQYVVNKEVMDFDHKAHDFTGVLKKLDETNAAVKHLEKVISKLPLQTFSFDEKGFMRSVQEGLSEVHYLNKRFNYGK